MEASNLQIHYTTLNKLLNRATKNVAKSLFALTLALMTNLSYAANHWSSPGDIHSVSPRAEGVFVFMTGVSVINPGGCSSANGYVIARDNPIFEDMYKTALTALASGIKFRAIVSDEPNRCIKGKPIVVFTSISTS